MTATKNRFYATGRRKEAVARVWISPGTGKIVVNDREFDNFFPAETHRMIVEQPLETLAKKGEYDIRATVRGGGTSGQAGAVRLGIARALVSSDEEFRRPLRRVGLLTRDARAVERKKYGQPGARKRFQFSKR
ncbi:MAG TPA: 30S ribosomal protein S9 [Candidatus Krumholzibacteria bacterium]|jgi:small subunit ribosomal protein S9